MRLYDCPTCGQLAASDEDGPDLMFRCPRVCDECRSSMFRPEGYESVRLFEPAPTELPGQTRLDL